MHSSMATAMATWERGLKRLSLSLPLAREAGR